MQIVQSETDRRSESERTRQSNCTWLTGMVMTTRVTLMVPGSKKALLSVILTPAPGLHSPTLTKACCFSFKRSSLNWIRRPSLNSIGPLSPLISTWNTTNSSRMRLKRPDICNFCCLINMDK